MRFASTIVFTTKTAAALLWVVLPPSCYLHRRFAVTWRMSSGTGPGSDWHCGALCWHTYLLVVRMSGCLHAESDLVSCGVLLCGSQPSSFSGRLVCGSMLIPLLDHARPVLNVTHVLATDSSCEHACMLVRDGATLLSGLFGCTNSICCFVSHGCYKVVWLYVCPSLFSCCSMPQPCLLVCMASYIDTTLWKYVCVTL